MLDGKTGERNPKDETIEKLVEIFDTSFEVLKRRDDGLENIANLLRRYELTKEEKNKLLLF